MNNNQELFFNHIKQLFLQNSNLDITPDIIYSELSIFNIEKDKIVRLNSESLVGIQVSMANKYRNNKSVNTFSNGYYWVIENRGKYHDSNYYEEVKNSIKLYVAVDPTNIFQVSSMVFDFIIKENIISQSKISKDMRSDALVLRVRTRNDAEKLINFINKNISYTSQIKPNPFIYNIGNVSMTLDGTLSYNSTFTKLLSKYLNEKRNQNELDKATLFEFKTWLIDQIDILKSNNRNLLEEYNINNKKQKKDFIRIIELLSKNIEGTISKEDVFDKQSERLNQNKEQEIGSLDNDYNYILHIMNGLVNKYGVEEAHERIMHYINKRVGADIFTSDKNIRNIVIDNFSPENMKKVLLSMGDNALINAINETINKYDIEQTRYAIRRLIEEKTIESFTNDNDARSYLGFIIPRELLEELIVDKTVAQKLYPSVDNMIYILVEEAQNINKSKGRN